MSRHSKLIPVLLVAILVTGGGLALYTVQTGAAPVPSGPAAGTVGIRPTATQALQVAQAAPSASQLPGGASALNETYQDWLVTCASAEGARRCALSQTQVQQNGQRVLAIELNPPSAGAVAGILALPFGLALEQGATLSIDESPVPMTLRFRTCLPVGCIVPIAFDLSMLMALKSGDILKVGTVADSKQEQVFSISLKGFAAAFDRLDALTR